MIERNSKMEEAKKRVTDIMDTMKPFEKIEIVADQEGTPDKFLVFRTQKIIITGIESRYIR